MKAPLLPSRSSFFCRLAALTTLAAALFVSPAFCQSTWTGATGGEWGTAGNWTGGVPNAIGATANINSALTVNVSDTGTGGTYPYTFGTLATTLASGNVVIGNNSITTDQLTAQVSSGTPTVNVANSSANIFYYANLLGTQGFNKAGAGKLTFRFNGADQPYTGNVTISAGIFGINQNGSLGDDNNDITIANGARLLAEPGSNSGTITLPSTRTITLSGAQSQLGANNAAVNLVIEGPVTESAAGQGLVKTDAGKVTLAGTVSYTGETRIAGGTLAFSGSALLPSGQNLRFNQNATGTLDVGGTAQTVRTIVMDVTSANRTFTGGGSLTVNGDANLQLGANNGVVYDFSGLNALIFNRSNRQFNFQTVNAASVTAITDLNLAKSGGSGGVNTVTASQVLVGGGNSDGNNGNTSRLHLGTENTFNSPTLQIGGFNAGGIVDFQSSLTAPFLKLRGADGSSAMATLKIGETSSGTRRGEGVLNLTGGSLDALVTDTIIGRHIAGANNNDTSSLTMPGGTLISGTLLLAEKTGTGTPTLTSTLTQGGGTVQIQTITLGKDAGGGATPKLLPTYNLNGGTLYAAAIDGGAGGFATDSFRTLNIAGGTLRNYDPSTDLTVDGTDATAAGLLNVVLGGGTQTISADAGRTITFTALAPISGTGGLSKQGAGTLLLNGANTFAGPFTVAAGTLAGTGSIAAVTTVDGVGTIAPGDGGIGTLTFGAAPTLNGTTTMEINRNSGSPLADKISGGAALGGTLTVVNVGAALQTGDTFDLFDGTLSGNFASRNLPHGLVHWITAGIGAGGDGTIIFTNNAPVAGNLTNSVAQGGVITIPFDLGKYALATDADGDGLSIISVSAGLGNVGTDGSSISYTNTSGSVGAVDSISFTVSDGLGGADTANIAVVITSATGGNLVSATESGGLAYLTYAGIPGQIYVSERTTNLTPPILWTSVATNSAGSVSDPNPGMVSFTNTIISPQSFFRTTAQ